MARPHTEPPLRTLAWWLFAGAAALSILLSSTALLNLGIPYDAPYGPMVAKIHPSSYLWLLAWFAALASHGNPVDILVRQFRSEALLSVYFGCMVLVFAWVVYRHGTSGAAYIVQTLWMPAIATYTLLLLAPAQRRQVVWLIVGLLACNAVIALVEYATKMRLVAIVPGQYGDDYFRSSALLGHPLLNAMVTIALLPAVTLLPLKTPARVALALLLLTSVLAYGARTALVGGVVVYGAALAAHLAHGIARGRYSYLQLTGGSVALMLALAALAAVVMATGLGERIFQNLVWDNSASVRTRVWESFDYLRSADWWLGVSPAGIDAISLKMGLDLQFEAIENFWIYMFLEFGVIGFVPFIVGIGALVALMLKRSATPMRFGVLLFFMVASTSNSLASKTVALTLLTLLIVAGASMRPRVAAAPPARRPAGWRLDRFSSFGRAVR